MTGSPAGPAELAAVIVRLLGGAGNVSAVAHCFVRLRLELVEPARADRAGLEALEQVALVVEQHGQLQLLLRGDLFAVHDAVREQVEAGGSP